MAFIELFNHPVTIDPYKLDFEPFYKDTQKIKKFDCGNNDLNEFLCTDEVIKYEDEKFGKTTLVYYLGELVAYYTLSNDLLKKAYVKRKHGFKMDKFHLEGIPSLTIGRLAVDINYQNKGIGRTLIQKIAMIGLDSSRYAGLRLLLVQAKEDAFEFYEKLGFQFVVETRNEKKRFKARGTRTMFFDLKCIDHLKK